MVDEYKLLTRVEGEGKLVLVKKSGRVVDARVSFTEPRRFYEKILVGRRVFDVLDIVSRICGICGYSHTYAAVKAFEDHIGLEIPLEVENYRVSILVAERVKSHLLHTCFLHLPDYLGVPSIDELYRKHSSIANTCLTLYGFIYRFLKLFGGRTHNVVNTCIGGIYRFPDNYWASKLCQQLRGIVKEYRGFLEQLLNLLDIEDTRYPLIHGSLHGGVFHSGEIVFGNRVVRVEEYEDFIVEKQGVESSEVRYCYVDGKPLIVGPLARFLNNYNLLHSSVREYIGEKGLKPESCAENPLCSIIARLLETYDSLLRLEDFLSNYRVVETKCFDREVSRGVYVAVIEAPRGLLYHRYVVGERGRISYSKIVTPTQINAYAMEYVARELIKRVEIDEEYLERLVLKSIRSFDPCISCAVHVEAL